MRQSASPARNRSEKLHFHIPAFAARESRFKGRPKGHVSAASLSSSQKSVAREQARSFPRLVRLNFNNRSMDNGLVLINSRDPIERRVTKATFALFAFLLKSERIFPAAFQFFFQAKYWQAGEKSGTRKRKIDEQFRNSIDRRPIQR